MLHLELCSSFSPTDGLVTWLRLVVGLRATWWAGKDCWRWVWYLHHQRFLKTTFGKDLSIMLMHRSCLLKVCPGYLLNDSVAVIPWHFCNMNYMQWFHVKKNKCCHSVRVLGLETIKEKNSMWLVTKCKQILSDSRHHYLIMILKAVVLFLFPASWLLL